MTKQQAAQEVKRLRREVFDAQVALKDGRYGTAASRALCLRSDAERVLNCRYQEIRQQAHDLLVEIGFLFGRAMDTGRAVEEALRIQVLRGQGFNVDRAEKAVLG